MKKLFCIFVLVLTLISGYSQNNFIKSYLIQNKTEILTDSILMSFLDQVKINVSDYNVIRLYDFIDTIATYRGNHNRFTLKKYQIDYVNLNDFKISYIDKIVGNKTKKQDNKKFLSCFRTLELNENKKYEIIFFIIEP